MKLKVFYLVLSQIKVFTYKISLEAIIEYTLLER